VGWAVMINTNAASPVSTATGINTTAAIHHHDSGLARHRRGRWAPLLHVVHDMYIAPHLHHYLDGTASVRQPHHQALQPMGHWLDRWLRHPLRHPAASRLPIVAVADPTGRATERSRGVIGGDNFQDPRPRRGRWRSRIRRRDFFVNLDGSTPNVVGLPGCWVVPSVHHMISPVAGCPGRACRGQRLRRRHAVRFILAHDLLS
jgi:hypothetical protein